MNTVTQSVLSTQYIQVPVTVRSPSGYDPTGDDIAFAFMPQTYPQVQPGSGDWKAGSWTTFAGPSYWAQVLVGPANGGIALAVGTYLGFVKISDSPEVPVLQPFMLEVTP